MTKNKLMFRFAYSTVSQKHIFETKLGIECSRPSKNEISSYIGHEQTADFQQHATGHVIQGSKKGNCLL